MRASGVNVSIMSVIGKMEQIKNVRARIGVARIMGFYCINKPTQIQITEFIVK